MDGIPVPVLLGSLLVDAMTERSEDCERRASPRVDRRLRGPHDTFEESSMRTGPWLTRFALATFAALLYWGVARDWWLSRWMSG